MSDTPQPPPDGPGSWPTPEGSPAGGPSAQGPSGQQWPPPQPGPPPTGAGWGPPPTAGAPVVVPAWVSSHWGSALWVAGVGQLLLLLGGVVITLFLLFANIAEHGLDLVDWGAIAVSPLAITLGWSGASDGAPLLITGVLYTFVAYRYAMRRASAVPTVLSSRPHAFALAGKVGVISAGLLLAAGILLNSFAEELLGRASGFWAARDLDLTSLVFFSLFVGALVSLAALLSVGRVSLVRLLGLRASTPAPVRLGALGARRTLLVGGVGLLVLQTLGSLLDDLSRGGLGLGDAGAVLLNTLASLLSTWLDTGVLLLLGTTKFLHDGGYVWARMGEVSGWMWLAIPVLLAAYIAGGIRAARFAQPTSQAEAAKAALLVGPLVAAVGLLAAVGWSGQSFIEDIVPIAILLPTLWGVMALVGAWLWANQQGLGSGLVIEQPQGQTTPPGEEHAAGWGPPSAPQAVPSPGARWDPPSGDTWGPPTGPPLDEPPPAQQQSSPPPDNATDHEDTASTEATPPDRGVDLDSLPPPDPSDRSQG